MPDPDALCYLLDATRDLCLSLACCDWASAAVGIFNTACWMQQARIL